MAPPSDSIGVSTRIGLTKGADARLRYFVAGSDYLSGSKALNTAPARPKRAPGRRNSAPG